MNVKLLKGNSMQKMEEIILSFFYFPSFFHYITLDHHISASTGTKALNLKYMRMQILCGKKGGELMGIMKFFILKLKEGIL